MKAKTIPQLTKEFSAILAENKDAFLRMFAEDVMGVEATVTGGYRTNGHGSSIPIMIGKGIKGKKYVEAAGWAIHNFKGGQIQKELKRLYPKAEIQPLMFQDITVNEFLQHLAGKWFSENGVKAEYYTRMD